MKILGAWMIAWGIISLMIGFVRLRVGWLFFLDEFGPVVGYVLKAAFIAIGVWVWRQDTEATEGDTETLEGRRAWIPVFVCGGLILGSIVFVTAGVVKDKNITKQIKSAASPASWAAKSPDQWPDLVLLQQAEFKHHSSMEAGCACLVRLPTGEIVALTAGHLLGYAGGVKPGFLRGPLGGLDQRKLATLTDEIVSWKLLRPSEEEGFAQVQGLYGKAKDYAGLSDEILLDVTPHSSGYPAMPLDLRFDPVTTDEPLRVIAFRLDRKGEPRQVIYKAKRQPGGLFTCSLDQVEDLNGCSGAPVVDKNGLLVGIVTGASLSEMNNRSGYVQSFSGRSVAELLPVLRAAVKEKGIASSPPAKIIVRPPKSKPRERDALPVSAKIEA